MEIINYPIKMLKSLFMSIFLGLKRSKDTDESFDSFNHFLNMEIISEDMEVFHGYVSKLNYSNKYNGCIIILHGISDNRRDFLGNYHFRKNMNEEFLYVVPEFPGFGESKLPFTKNGCYKMILLWMKYVKDFYNIDDFIIAGQSFGSTLGLVFYEYMYKHGRLEKSTDLRPKLILSFVPQHEKRISIKLEDNEKFKIRKIILYSPFAITNDAIIEYYSLQWFKFILKPIINLLINNEIDFNLTKISKDLDDSIITVIYSLSDKEVPPINSIRIKSVLKNACFVEFRDHNHINLFIDTIVWNDNYREIITGTRQVEIKEHFIRQLNEMRCS